MSAKSTRQLLETQDEAISVASNLLIGEATRFEMVSLLPNTTKRQNYGQDITTITILSATQTRYTLQDVFCADSLRMVGVQYKKVCSDFKQFKVEHLD